MDKGTTLIHLLGVMQLLQASATLVARQAIRVVLVHNKLVPNRLVPEGEVVVVMVEVVEVVAVAKVVKLVVAELVEVEATKVVVVMEEQEVAAALEAAAVMLVVVVGEESLHLEVLVVVQPVVSAVLDKVV